MVYRIYVEKKPGFDVEATGLKNELTSLLGIQSLTGLRLLNRYDVEGIDEELFNQCANTVFSEPPVDNTYAELPASDGVSFAVGICPASSTARRSCWSASSSSVRASARWCALPASICWKALTDEQVARSRNASHQPGGGPRGFAGHQADPENGVPRARPGQGAGGL